MMIGKKSAGPVSDRISREKTFHDDAYKFDSRGSLAGLYIASSTIRRRYMDTITESCTGKKVLEYGCGLGSYGHLLASRGAHVTGIDISEYVISEARKLAQQVHVDIDFRIMDAEKLDFGDQSFDLICGTGILHHLNLQRAASEIRRVLRPGARAIFIEPMGHNPAINLFRLLTPHMRSTDEHPLTIRDLAFLDAQFPRCRVAHYYLLSLCALPLHSLKIFAPVLDICNIIDQKLLLWLPFLRRYSWQVLIAMEN